MAENKNKSFMAKLSKIDGAVNDRSSIHTRVLSTKSPSFNFIFGNGWGLPLGYTMALSGPPKAGKTVISKFMVAQMHADYTDGWALVFNTEMRDRAQLSTNQARLWGIDLDRYKGFDVNRPELIFDTISHEIVDLMDQGMDVKMIVIDSISSVLGRAGLKNDSVLDRTFADKATTIGEGLGRVLELQRKYNFGLILPTQIRAEMDPHEVARGNKTRMAAAFQLQHHAEYFCFVDEDTTLNGRSDILGNKLEDLSMTDIKDDAERTGHKIRFCMKNSSCGPKRRAGAFTFDYKLGIINTHEEVFQLGVNRGVIIHPSNSAYEFEGAKWHGRPSMLDAIKNDHELYNKILAKVKEPDIRGLTDGSVVE